MLDHLDISKEDATKIMDRLVKGQPEGVDFEALLDCAIYLRGPARSLHLHQLMAESASIRDEVLELSKAHKQLLAWLPKRLQNLERQVARDFVRSEARFDIEQEALTPPVFIDPRHLNSDGNDKIKL